MKKILLTSMVTASILFAASNPSTEYNYEVTPYAAGILSDAKTDLKDDNYPNVGIGIARNFSDIFINQLELSYFRSAGLNYKSIAGSTYVNRYFLNAIKYLPLSEKFKLYGLAGAGYQNVTRKTTEHDDSAILNYGLGLKYDIPYYGIALKSDIRHLYAIENRTDDIMYTFGIGMPLGSKPMDVKTKIQEVEEIEDTFVDGDDDGDGVPNSKDKCPNTVAGAIVDEFGCELDDDNDGVPNRLDKCPNTSEGVKVNKDGCVETVDLKINFEYNSAKIQEQYISHIEEFANMMKDNPKLTAVIEAHTDSIGSEAYNLKLSDRRATSATQAIENFGISSSKLKPIGYGKSQPIASNDTAEGRAENRRVVGYLNQ